MALHFQHFVIVSCYTTPLIDDTRQYRIPVGEREGREDIRSYPLPGEDRPYEAILHERRRPVDDGPVRDAQLPCNINGGKLANSLAKEM